MLTSGATDVSPPTYQEAMSAAPERDRAFATELGGQMIGLVKLFGALRARMASSPDSDSWTVPVLGKIHHHHGRVRAVELAEQLGADPSTISRQVAALVKAGLVERQADPEDGRASILVLTDSGRRTLVEHGVRRGQAMAPLISHWSESERSLFLDLLARFNTDLSTNLEPIKDSVAGLIQAAHTNGSNA